MILTERQIKKIKDAWIKAERAEHKAHAAAEKLRKAIVKATGVDGQVDYMAGDGHGFTPAINDDTHIYIGDLIKMAEDGEDITEELILDSLAL
jgi:hypothetical protein